MIELGKMRASTLIIFSNTLFFNEEVASSRRIDIAGVASSILKPQKAR